MDSNHPDFANLSGIRDDLVQRLSQHPESLFAQRVWDAIEFVLDTVRTGRTRIADLDKIEKTFVGLKIEHFIRDLLDVPQGRRDLLLGGRDVDIKTTVVVPPSWMIPPETFRDEEPVLLISADENNRVASLGLFIARASYLTAPNRDGKRGISKSGRSNILWLRQNQSWPKDRWSGIDLVRFRELRKVQPGALRAALFCEENLGRVTHRTVAQALLHDQLDYMKRLRGNNGARDILSPKGIEILFGTEDAKRILELGLVVDAQEFIALRKQA